MLKIRNIMTKDVVTFTEDAPILRAIIILTENRVRGAPVVDKERRVVGIVSESDIVRMLKRQAEARRKSRRLGEKYETRVKSGSLALDALSFLSADWLWYLWNARSVGGIFKTIKESDMIREVTVKDIMTVKVVSVGPDEPIRKALELMNHHDINRVPVVNEGNRLVGIVARADIIRALANQPGKGD